MPSLTQIFSHKKTRFREFILFDIGNLKLVVFDIPKLSFGILLLSSPASIYCPTVKKPQYRERYVKKI